MLKPTERILFTQKNRAGTLYSTGSINHDHQLIDSCIVDVNTNKVIKELNFEETMKLLEELMKPKSSLYNMAKKEEIKRTSRAWVFLPDSTKTMFNIYTDKIHSYIKWNKKWWEVIYRPEYGEYDVLWEADLEALMERKEEK